jgi:hypothetical protein
MSRKRCAILILSGSSGRLETDRARVLAGHRLRFPGERPVAPSIRLAHGGSPEADAAFGRRVWPPLLELLRLRDTAG